MKHLTQRLLALVAIAALTACNPNNDVKPGEEDTALPDVTPDVADVGMDAPIEVTPDVAPDVPPEVVEEVSDPPEPELLIVKMAPARGVYSVGQRVTPTALIYDQYAEEMDGLDVTWRVEPENAATDLETGSFTLDREGAVTFRGCTPLNEDGTLNLCGVREIIVDAGAPTIEIFTPQPGEELVSAEHRVVTVTGRATDTNGTVRVYVAGERAVLDSYGNFSVDFRPTYGINHVPVVASDGLHSSSTKRAVDFMWAPYYHPVETDPITGNINGSYPQGLLLSLNQRYLDGDVTIVIDPENPILTTEDIAGLLEFVISEVDIMSFIGTDPIADSESFALTIPSATLGDPDVDIRVTNDGLEIFIGIPGLYVNTEGNLTLSEKYSLNGAIGLSASALIDLVIHKDSAEEPLVVEARSIEIALEDARGEFEADEINAVLELAEGLLFGTLEGLVLQALEDAFLADLPLILADALGSIEGSIINETIDLDLGLGGPPIAMSLAAQLESIVPEARSALVVDFGFNVSTTVPPAYPTSRGIAMNYPFDAEPPLFSSSRVQIAARVPMLNGILHTLWNSGLLNIDATEVLPDAVSFLLEGATVTGRMPPHLTATRPDTLDYQFVLTVGQMEMEIWKGDKRDFIGINLHVGVSLEIIDNQLNVVVQTEPQVTMWLIDTLGEETIFPDVSALQSLFVSILWPMLTEQLETGLTIDLPEIDLSSIGDLAPRLSDLTLNLVLDNPIEIREGYFVIDGAFEGVADLSE